MELLLGAKRFTCRKLTDAFTKRQSRLRFPKRNNIRTPMKAIRTAVETANHLSVTTAATTPITAVINNGIIFQIVFCNNPVHNNMTQLMKGPSLHIHTGWIGKKRKKKTIKVAKMKSSSDEKGP